MNTRPISVRRVLAGLTAAGAAGLLAGSAPAAEVTSEHSSFATFREQGERLTVIVDAYPASLREAAAFIPVPIAVGLMGRGGPVRFHEESFTLVDASGREFPLASYSGLIANYPQRTFDATLLKQWPIVTGGQFESMTEATSRFFPAPGAETRTELVELSPFTWFRDVLYFPRPADMHGVLTLKIRAPGLEHPAELRFQVPERRKSGNN